MFFNEPSPLLQRVIRLKAIKHKDGKLTLWNIPGLLSALYVTVYQQRLMEKLHAKEAANILYNLGRFQAIQGFRMTAKHFGYAKSIESKRRLLEFNTGQSEIVGTGKYKWIKMDFEKNLFLVVGKSTLAEEYKRFFGIQKMPVDHFMRGQGAGYIEELTGKKMLCVETKCIAMGHEYCEFVIKQFGEWDKKDRLVKEQIFTQLPDMKNLGAKMEPYLSLPS
ncbi:MAG: V4R domain-containing protein [archaeon]